MRSNYNLFLNLVHGMFLGFVFGITISILTLEFSPEIREFIHPAYIYPILSVLGAIIGYVKGLNNYSRLLYPLFSTTGTVLTPIIAIVLIYFLLGFDRLLALPPIVFKSGIGLRGMDPVLSSYIFTFLATSGFIGAVISSFSINKKNRWSF
ncbi:hypothetical protein [Clostridium formicaceticum]|uniref:Uncharacterized protein n=1 Tax=Clostridium formicaceticum TaxID=1497 RepID=A0AAC9WG71_9CLOT|nr:hypothetical protein [Clostridium formicaceticum]AOY77005.1 hypothetical protein BJL90_14755 [Clostridium formicaceticum]ARE87494.1 hypothetical protein CLFO_18940 [Clostridium formicaceticum]